MSIGALEFKILADLAGLKRDMDRAKGLVGGAADGMAKSFSAVKGARPGLPIIAVSDRRLLRGLDLFHMATVLGADAVLEKPFEGETLLATVAGLLWAARAT